jgi:MFS-type transporter involved in bile tolerance (Atg22 family)
MLNLPCNIEANERVTRVVIGAVLFIAALLGLGRGFLFLVGIVLIAEAFIGFCGIPMLAEKFKLNDMFKKKNQQP